MGRTTSPSFCKAGWSGRAKLSTSALWPSPSHRKRRGRGGVSVAGHSVGAGLAAWLLDLVPPAPDHLLRHTEGVADLGVLLTSGDTPRQFGPAGFGQSLAPA